MDRKCSPSFAEMMDILIVYQIKQIKDPDNHEDYETDIQALLNDIGTILEEEGRLDGQFIRTIVRLSQVNLHIWNARDNEETSKAHEFNAIRNSTKAELMNWKNCTNTPL